MEEKLSYQKRYALALENMANPLKNVENGFTKSKYATLDQILRVVKPALSEQGFALMQSSRKIESEWCLVTEVLDSEADEHERNPIVVVDCRPLDMSKKAQERGADQTYERRYALMMAFGLAPVEDKADSLSVADAREQKEYEREMQQVYQDFSDACEAYAVICGADLKQLKQEKWRSLQGKPKEVWIKQIEAMREYTREQSKARIEELGGK